MLLALTAVVGVAAPVAADAITKPSSPPPVSPLGSAEPAAPRGAEERTSMRGFVELIALVVTCAAVIAYYSVTAGEPGGTRVPARVRRR